MPVVHTLEGLKAAVDRLVREHDTLVAKRDVDKEQLEKRKREIQEHGFSSVKELKEALEAEKADYDKKRDELEKLLRKAGAI